MRSRKLKESVSKKRTKSNKRRKTMKIRSLNMNGAGRSTYSTRSDTRTPMPQRNLGHDKDTKLFDDQKVRDFVDEEIQFGPQIVTLPTKGERHSFLVDVPIEEGNIMISDWGGVENLTAYTSNKKKI